MTTPSTSFEFQLPSNGDLAHYLVQPVHSEEGKLQELSIQHNPPADAAIAVIAIDPQLFTQFALPNVETFCRIAIAQAATEGAFERPGSHVDMTLDLTIEPWEGELAAA